LQVNVICYAGETCMYLRVSDQRFALDNNHDVIYQDTKMPHTVIVDQYVCLFDNEWRIVEEVWEYLHNRLHMKHLAFNSVITKGTDLKLYYDFLNQYKIQYTSVSQKTINDFIAWLLQSQSPRTAKTVNRIISSIKDFYRYHESLHKVNNPFKSTYEAINNPARKNSSFFAHTKNTMTTSSIYKIKEFDRGIRVLSKEQIETILSACTMERDRLLFELLLFTGMRIGEALSLDIHAIGISKISSSVQELSMHSNEKDHQKGSRYRQQKSGTRDLFIPTVLMEKLSDYYERIWLKIYETKEMEHEFFFVSEFHNNLGEPLSYQAVWERCRLIGKKTGVFFTPHDFRHTYATLLARNKVSIHKLRKLLGHTHIASTDIYIQIADKEQIIEDLIPFFESYGVIHE